MQEYNGQPQLSGDALAAAVKQLPPGQWIVDPKPNGGAVIYYNFEGVLDAAGTPLPEPERTGEPAQLVVEPERGTFADRVASRYIDLVKLIEQGLPALDFLPASDEMLVRGKRHAVAAPAKDGKSLAWLAHEVDMVLAGAWVVIFDRENGASTYAMRLRNIMNARRLNAEQRALLSERLAYHEFPQLGWGDAEALEQYCNDVDLVVFDSQRMFLSDLGLKEDASDDYATFMAALIDPLFRAGIATLTLDNTGHSDKKRGRGSSSKGDLNEILFSLQKVEPFDLYNSGLVKLKVEMSRFGNMGEWSMKLGGGEYGSWVSGGPAKPREDFLAAVVGTLMKYKHPLGMDRLIAEVRKTGVSIGTDKARDLLNQYVGNPETPVIWNNGYALRSDPAATPEADGVAPTPETGGVGRRGNPAES